MEEKSINIIIAKTDEYSLVIENLNSSLIYSVYINGEYHHHYFFPEEAAKDITDRMKKQFMNLI